MVKARMEQAGPYYEAFLCLDEADRENVQELVTKLINYIPNMGVMSACELLVKLGVYLIRGGERHEHR